jgi:hypothetical protein
VSSIPLTSADGWREGSKGDSAVSDSAYAAPPNQRPPPEVVAARLSELDRAHRKRRRPYTFTGPADVLRAEARWLLKSRGLSPDEIEARIAGVRVWNSKRAGEHFRLSGADKDKFRIRQMRAFDRTTKEQAEIVRSRKNERRRTKRVIANKGKTPMKIDMRLGEVVAQLDYEVWRSGREIGDALSTSPAFAELKTTVSRQAMIRQLIGKLVKRGEAETDMRAGPFGMATYARRLWAGATTVH